MEGGDFLTSQERLCPWTWVLVSFIQKSVVMRAPTIGLNYFLPPILQIIQDSSGTMALGYSTRICFLTEASTILSPTTSRMGL
jgi:hypothetical protein